MLTKLSNVKANAVARNKIIHIQHNGQEISWTVLLVLQWCFLEARSTWTMLTKATCWQMPQAMKKKPAKKVCTATLIMKHLRESCTDNRMHKLSWRNWWAMFSQRSWWWGILTGLAWSTNLYTGTVVKKLMYDAYTARPTKKCLQGPCMVNRMYTGTVVKKLMYDAYTARPTKKCLQGSRMDNRIKKLLWRNWWMLTQQDLQGSVFKGLAWTTE